MSDETKPAVKPTKQRKKKILVREFVSVKHTYTQVELNEHTRLLTTALQEVRGLEDDLKTTTQDFKARITASEARINENANKLTNGYEMRQVEVTVEFDRKKGKKKLFRHCPGNKEHGKLLREEPMTKEDYSKLPLDLPAVKPKDEKPAGKKSKVAAGGDALDENQISECIEVIRAENKASVSLLQRRLKIGYTKATAILDELEKRGVVGPAKGVEPRDILKLPEAKSAEPAAPEKA